MNKNQIIMKIFYMPFKWPLVYQGPAEYQLTKEIEAVVIEYLKPWFIGDDLDFETKMTNLASYYLDPNCGLPDPDTTTGGKFLKDLVLFALRCKVVLHRFRGIVEIKNPGANRNPFYRQAIFYRLSGFSLKRIDNQFQGLIKEIKANNKKRGQAPELNHHYLIHCENCGKIVISRRSDTRSCSTWACRKALYRRNGRYRKKNN